MIDQPESYAFKVTKIATDLTVKSMYQNSIPKSLIKVGQEILITPNMALKQKVGLCCL
ncbi:MAG: hypothetical protein CM1200mP16_11300 [Nitrospina sp.]|nr:MAG: hypothetical protein CM1200mP16_11300 [Nitrospina sp.]